MICSVLVFLFSTAIIPTSQPATTLVGDTAICFGAINSSLIFKEDNATTAWGWNFLDDAPWVLSFKSSTVIYSISGGGQGSSVQKEEEPGWSSSSLPAWSLFQNAFSSHPTSFPPPWRWKVDPGAWFLHHFPRWPSSSLLGLWRDQSARLRLLCPKIQYPSGTFQRQLSHFEDLPSTRS